MKRIQILLLVGLISLILAFFATSALADMLVIDVDPPDTDTNPQWVTPSDPADERSWLGGLLSFPVSFISKDEDANPLDDVPTAWTYAVLKYGVGKPAIDNPDHWAIVDDGDFVLEVGDIIGLPSVDSLSHVSYFGQPIPEPATILLIGSGLIGLAGYGKKKFFKK